MPVTHSVGLNAYINAVLYLCTVIVPVGLVAWRMERRDRFALRIALCCAVMLAVMLVSTALIQAVVVDPRIQSYVIYFHCIKYFAIFILSGASVCVCFKCGVWHALFCATIGYCLQHIAARISSVIVEMILPPVHWALNNFISIVIAAAVDTSFYFATMRKSKINYASVSVNKVQILISGCVVGVSIFYNSLGISYAGSVTMLFGDSAQATALGTSMLLFVYIMSLIVAVLALLLDLSVCYGNQVGRERDKLNAIMDEGRRQYELQKSNVEMLNVKYHDLKHQLGAMKGKIYDEQIEELQSAIRIYDSSIKTGNEALDVVLTQKSFYCANRGIRLTCMLDGSHYGHIAKHELYALFNNAIDNAIEAVEKIDEEKRVISITEKVTGNIVSVRVENYFDGNVNINGDMPTTSKTGDGHGYGVKSMKMIAEKYGGGISVSVDGELFVLDVFFPVASDTCKT